ncbi:hypothetical protein DRH27_01295 [Candidatus Falkowbacteria bacterium]|nr:MAG: hypothetical protein DRH27_01295 [Candidatus Falkowbacteria bacterium]
MKYREIANYKYQLMEELTYPVSWPDSLNPSDDDFVFVKDGKLILREHYAWDGSTVPAKGLFAVVGWNADKFCNKASVIHDALYQLMRAGRLDRNHKNFADRLYRSLCISGGMSRWQADLRFWALQKFGSLKYQALTPKILEMR